MDVLVAGAAGNFICAAEELSPNGFRTVIEIDLLGAFHASRLGFAQLKQTRGCLIYISAPQASVPQACQAHVGAAKAGIDMMMRNLAIEWGRHGIRTNSVVPGPIADTEGLKRLLSEADAAELSRPCRWAATARSTTSARRRSSWRLRWRSTSPARCCGRRRLVLIGSALQNRQLASCPAQSRLRRQPNTRGKESTLAAISLSG